LLPTFSFFLLFLFTFFELLLNLMLHTSVSFRKILKTSCVSFDSEIDNFSPKQFVDSICTLFWIIGFIVFSCKIRWVPINIIKLDWLINTLLRATRKFTLSVGCYAISLTFDIWLFREATHCRDSFSFVFVKSRLTSKSIKLCFNVIFELFVVFTVCIAWSHPFYVVLKVLLRWSITVVLIHKFIMKHIVLKHVSYHFLMQLFNLLIQYICKSWLFKKDFLLLNHLNLGAFLFKLIDTVLGELFPHELTVTLFTLFVCHSLIQKLKRN